MKKIILLILFTIVSIIFSGKVSANTAPIGWEGSRGTEPRPLEDCPIEVEKERLEFKLESRMESYTIRSRVKAVYSLHNPTDSDYTLTAVFPVITGFGDGQDPLYQKIRLNGEEIPYKAWIVDESRDGKSEKILDSLTLEEMLKRRKAFTPQDTYFEHGPYPILMLEFDAEIPPGETYRLEITTKTTAFMERDPMFTYGTKQVRYTFLYYLSPAQYWADFKDLDVVIKTSSAAPVLMESNLDFHWAGWRRYRFHSGTLPAGELSFTVKKSFWYTPVRWAFFIALIIGAFVLWDKWDKKKYGH